MPRIVANVSLRKISLGTLLFVVQCGVKLPPRAARLQEGPNDAFAIGKTGVSIPNTEPDPNSLTEEEKKKQETSQE